MSVSGGCTPTAELTRPGVLSELRPGVYVFNDAGQLALGSAAREDIALTVRTTVVSTAVPGQVVIDAGAKMLGLDRPAWVEGHGLVPAYPLARIARVWENHGVLEIPAGSPRPGLGEQLERHSQSCLRDGDLVDVIVAGAQSWP